MRFASCALLVILSSVPSPGQHSTPEPDKPVYPLAPPSGQVDVIHGLEIADPYRWLEVSSPETQDWVRSEDRLMQHYLENEPARGRLRRRMEGLIEYEQFAMPQVSNPPVVKENGRYFFLKLGAGRSTPVLYLRDAGGARPILDLSRKYKDGDIRFVSFVPSPDGRYVAYGLSEKQSNWITLHLLQVDSGQDEDKESLTDIHVTGAPPVWDRTGKGFFYTSFKHDPLAGTNSAVRDPKILFHKLGQAQSEDALIYARPDRPGWLYSLSVTHDGRYLILEARDGAARHAHVFYKDLVADTSEVAPLIAETDADYSFLGSQGRNLYFYTDWNAPLGRVIAVDLDHPAPAEWREVVPQAQEAIAGRSSVGGNAIGMFGRCIVLMYLKDGRPFLRLFDLEGRLRQEIALPAGGSIWGGLSGSQEDPEVFFQYLGLTDPSTVYRLDVGDGKTEIFLRAHADFEPGDYVIEQVFYTSKDGTRVPMLVAHHKRFQRDGSHPTWMYAYGAFGWVSFVWYQPHILAWLDMGGVFAIPAVRGGGEYGEPWHQAGMKEHRQNAIEDYLFAAKWLIANRFTTPRLLVANGGSASGALAAAALQQAPKLFGAVVIDRPVLDLVRFDRFTAGGYWASEFGSPSDSKELRILYSYSPYHRLQRGACYPPALIMSGDQDQVAVPAHAYKFTARMQAAQGCANPVLLKVMWGAGHNFGATPQQNVDSWTDALSFLVRVLRLKVPEKWDAPAGKKTLH